MSINRDARIFGYSGIACDMGYSRSLAFRRVGGVRKNPYNRRDAERAEERREEVEALFN